MPYGEKSDVSTATGPSVDIQTKSCHSAIQFSLVEFERPVICPMDSLIIASRLDAEAHILSKVSILCF